MEIRINKQWVIYTAKNGSGVILGKIPEKMQDLPDLDVTKLGSSNLYHYATAFGAIQGLFKHGVKDTDAQSFAELEAKIESIAQECQAAFTKALSAKPAPEGFVLISEGQAKDTERLNFLLSDERYVRTVVQRDIQNEDYDKIGEHFLFTEMYWIDGWDYHENTSSQSKRGALDKAMLAAQEQAND